MFSVLEGCLSLGWKHKSKNCTPPPSLFFAITKMYMYKPLTAAFENFTPPPPYTLNTNSPSLPPSNKATV